jgi:three-Cys-motif partner protein
MAVPSSVLWPIQPHTQAKHLILRRYLQAWLPIMATHNGRIVFVDGFAGPGRYSGGEDGSPIIALKALLDHPHFKKRDRGFEVVLLFIEEKEERAVVLEEAIRELGAESPFPSWVKCDVLRGEFAPNLERVLGEVERAGRPIAPTFAFIDPFGFSGLPLSTLARLVRNPKCEVLINFSLESINRFLEHPDDGIARNFDELFGTKDWRNMIDAPVGTRGERLVRFYQAQLASGGGLAFVRAFEMINEGNRTEYVLVFGTNSDKGLSKMKEAMWKADPERGQAFSDRTDPDQMILLQTGGEVGLEATLTRQFRGKGFVSIEEVERFVLVDTPFCEARHLKRRTLAPMERATPPRIEVGRPQGSPIRAGSYPRLTILKFL